METPFDFQICCLLRLRYSDKTFPRCVYRVPAMLYDKYSNELLMKIYEIEFWRLQKTIVKSSHVIGDLDVTNSFIVMFFVIESTCPTRVTRGV